MSKTLTITPEVIINQLKVSCKVEEVVQKLMARQIISDTAEELGIIPDDQAIQKMADDLRLARNLISADDTFKWLEKYYLSLDDFEEIAYTALLSTEVATRLFANKVEPYFFENQLDYIGVVMYEVILDDQDLAMELFYSIQEGEISFHEVTHKYIQDPELRRQGGYRGILRRKDLKPEVSAAVLASKPPKLLKPIVTSLGINLIFVEDLIQPKLDAQLRLQINTDLFEAWINREINNWKVITKL